MPCNLYGVGDTYDSEKSHVIPGLIIKFHKARIENLPFVECWGTGVALREFLYVTDLAKACVQLLDNYNSDELVNVGSSEELSIKQLTVLIANVVGYTGEIRWNPSVPNGTPRKILNNDKITSMGWKPKISLDVGLKLAYDDYINRYDTTTFRIKQM